MRSTAPRFPTFPCSSHGSVRSKSGGSSITTMTSIRCTSTSTTFRSRTISIRAPVARRVRNSGTSTTPTCRCRPWRPGEFVIQPGALSLRMSFDDFTGLFVMHCHRLNHEDNGLMTLINVIPGGLDLCRGGSRIGGHAAQVKVYDGNGDRLLATVVPFKDFEERQTSPWAMSMTTASTTWWSAPERTTRPRSLPMRARRRTASGRSTTEIAHGSRRSILPRAAASAWPSSQIDGSTADNIIVGSGPGIPSEVKVFSATLPSSPGTAPAAVLDIQSLSRRSQRRERRLGLRRLLDRPLQHRHRSRRGSTRR